MQTERSPDEFYSWVIEKTYELAQSKESKTYARSGDQLAKKFYDELYPLAVFINHEYSGIENLRIKPSLGNENYDAVVTLESGLPISFIEITYAKDGHDESLRMEYLEKHGHVCLTGQITKEGRRNSNDRSVLVDNEAACHETAVQKSIELISVAIQKKSSKHYGDSHTLLVIIDDYYPLREDRDHQRVHQVGIQMAANNDLDFKFMVTMGISGKLFFSYKLNKA